MSRNAKVVCFSIFFAAIIALSSDGQILLSGGGSAYAGSGGLMPGGGVEFEYWFSLTERREPQGLNLGVGLEYFALTTTVTKTQGSGWVFPFTIKYGFPLGRGDLQLGLGGGAAMVLSDQDVQDGFGGYYVSSVVGGAPFAEGTLYWFILGNLHLQIVLRAGALFNETGTVPFVGARLLLGYYFELPSPSTDYNADEE